MEPDDEIEAIEIRLLLEAIHARYGYDLREYAAYSMRRRVLAALARTGLQHLGELQHRVLSDPRFFAQVLEDLTIRVSDMFRDPRFYRAFRERVIPMLRTYPLLKIWHAGCATGEEAYASAIMLSEEGLYDRAQIYATDISGQALHLAKQGVYDADRLRAFEENYAASGGTASLSRYCTAAYDHVVMAESLRRNILFFQHNLVSDHVFGEMHVIFCRNVFIYFSNQSIGRTVGTFASHIRPPGHLFVAASESLLRITEEFELQEIGNAFVYVRRPHKV
jgi:chemotaxis protein methyltransferase CheR